MALIKCPDCRLDVSDAAYACPACGCPIRELANPVPVATPQPQPLVIEQTSKRWKAGMLQGIGLVVLGFALIVVFPKGVGAWVVLMGIGVLLFVLAAVGAWWNHS